MRKIKILFLILFLGNFSPLYAQITIRDFVLFGKEAVQLSSSSNIIDGGKVGSNNIIRTSGTATLNSGLHSKGIIQLANSNTIQGNISAANFGNHTGTGIQIGSNTNIQGTLDANGNITITSGVVVGPIVSSGTYNGPQPTSGNVIQNGSPTLPALPDLPQLLVPAIYNNINPAVVNTATITPGSYVSMGLTGNKTVTFSGSGDYVFESIFNSGNFNKFVFDFKGNTSSIFRIFVNGNVDLNKILIEQINLPLPATPTSLDIAARVLMQVNGSGGTNGYAWSISNGASGNNQSNFYGTVVAPNGSINIGSGSSLSKIVGGLWSGKTVNIQSGVSITYSALICSQAIADAGPDKTITCPETSTILGSNASDGITYKWTTIINGVETEVGNQKQVTVTKTGTYVLAVSNNCGVTTTDTVEVSYISCVEPITLNPEGRVDNLIGPVLYNLNNLDNLEETLKHIVILGSNNDSVLIEAVAIVGFELQARNVLWNLGLRDTIPNGINPLLITGVFPIANLLMLLEEDPITQIKPASYIKEIRPVYFPVISSGLVSSAGDISVGANLVRNGFNVSGENVKIGVISDSYNSLNAANVDISNGDLPGISNPDENNTPVQIIKEFPWGVRTDEGRAMLQIVHDLAPKAELAFRTGFISAGDFAQGIIQLKEAGCNIIVDDVTYITEPFFKDGIVSKAVDMVSAGGVSYFTSAGNFGSKSYTNNFNPLPVTGISGAVHNFGGGDILQKLKLKSGIYSIVLQWQDDVYSIGNGTTGALNDFDIYLVDPGGSIGFNRNNLGGDPLEVLSFSINLADTSQVVEADLMIVKAGSAPGALANPLIKYIIFRGNATIEEYYSGQPLTNKSTIVGHANSAHAIAVGAVLFSNTPAFGELNPTVASFSSTGGTPIFNGTTPLLRAKPELTGPNGVNTTVLMGLDYDGDGFSNFFGTSASAPHAAAVAALVKQARKKYYDEELNPDALKYILFNTAVPMQPDGIVGGVNFKAGYGLVQADLAIRSFANPTPHINSLSYNSEIVPGQLPFILTVKGEYLSSSSIIYFRGEPIETVVNDDLTELTGEIPVFTGNPPINVFSPSFEGATNDGGLSNSLYFFTAIKDTVRIIADNKIKLYGETLPELTTTILLNGDTLEIYNQKNNTNITREDLGVNNLNIRYTDASINSLTNVGSYQIRASRSFDSENELDVELLEKYHYDSTFGNLQIQPLAITVIPKDTTIVYGNAIGNFHFDYVLPDNVNISDPSVFINSIKTIHEGQLANDVIAFANGVPVAIINGVPVAIVNIMINGVPVAVVNGVPVSIVNGVPVSIVNGVPVAYINGVPVSVVNGQSLKIINGSPLVVASILANGVPVAIVNGVPVAFVNAVPVSYVNGVPVSYVNGVPVSYVNSVVNGVPVAVVNGVPVAYVNTIADPVVINKGFMATSNAIENAREIVNADQVTKVVDLTHQSIFDFNINPDTSATSVVNSIESANLRGILNLTQLLNGVPVAYVNGVPVSVVNGVPVSIVNGVPVAYINGVPVSIVNSESQNPVIIDEEDLEGSGFSYLKSVNLVTGITAGLQSIIPGALLSDNLIVNYQPGTLTILPAPLTIKAKNVSKVYGEEITLDTTDFEITNGSLIYNDVISYIKLTSEGVSSSALPGTYPIFPSGAVGGINTELTNYSIIFSNGILTVNDNVECLLTHSKFTSFNSTTKDPTSLWLSIEIKISGQLSSHGDYVMYSGGTVDFFNIISSPTVSNHKVKRGMVIADNTVLTPVSHFDVAKDMFITKVPLGFSSTADIFISAVLINSSNGFTKKNSPSSILKGIFYSNKPYSEQWNYSIAAYQNPDGSYFNYSDLSTEGSIVAHNGDNYKGGTPLPWLSYVVPGGSGNGGNNYTGTQSSNDNFTACQIGESIVGNSVITERITEIPNVVNFNVFPNPATTVINISFVPETSGTSNISLYSIDGRKMAEVFNGVTEAGKTYNKQMLIGDLPYGIYLISLQEKGNVRVKKIVLNK